MTWDHHAAGREPYDILIRSVGQGIREVYGATSWEQVEAKAEGLWRLYAGSTGLAWADVLDRVRDAWERAGTMPPV
jgi:hypothetical protein